VLSAQPEYRNPPVVFMFPGGGTQYVGMGRELYEQEPVFREHLDACAAAVSRQAKLDLHALLYPTADQQPYAAAQLERPSHFLPAVFSVSYALAQLWMSWGVRPEAMIGHSLGEYVAACLAGVMSLEDALKLVCVRGLLSEQLPAAAMLIVPLAEREIVPLLGEALVIAAINGPEQCVVAGPIAAINALEQQLTAREVICRRLRVAGASHTPLVEPIIEPFLTALSSLRLSAPQTPYVSNVTGTWITAEQATSPAYWADHLRHTVRFSDGAGLLLEDQRRVLLEIGPGRTLSTLAKLVPTGGRQQVILTSLRHPQEPQSDVAFLLATVGRLWLAGVSLDWAELHRDEPRRRVALPTYPFERQRFFIERQAGLPLARDRQAATPAAAPQPSNQKNPDPARWFYAPSWRREPPPAGRALAPEAPEHWLVFSDGWGLAERLVQRLRAAGQGVVTAAAGASFARLSPTDYQLDPARGEDYRQLLGALIEAGQMPQVIVHCWGVTAPELQRALESSALDRGFFSLLLLAQALDQHDCADPLDLVVVTSDQHDVLGHEPICPEKATVLGPCTVIPQEYPQIACRSVDLSLPAPEAITDTLIEQLIGDCLARSSSAVIAYRGSYRWVRSFGPVSPAAAARPGRLRQRGVYLITGGLGGVGLAVSEYLAEHAQARLVLVGRSSFPEASGWDEWLSSHPAQDATSQKIRQLRSLEARGAEILIARADVSDLQQVRDVVAQAQERFGAVHGIIHAAALPGSGMIALKPQAVAASVLGPKVQGTRVLEAVSRELPLDFIVLCSSLTAVAGGIGQIDYCAANAFLDAFASYLRRTTDIFVTSIDWGDVWQVGGVVNTLDSLVPRELRDMRESAIQKGISPEEGAAAFARVLLHCDAPQIVVSSRDIEAAIVDTFSYARLQGEIDKYLGESAANARPQIETTYVAPTNDVEQHLAEIWQALLGIERIGIHDNFFELGGHSLLATLLVSRLNATFEIKLPLRRIFEAPTIAALAIVVEERLIEELETLSDEEAIKAL
jgi:acyl transferase domain-containing protein/acyl carrier protein